VKDIVKFTHPSYHLLFFILYLRKDYFPAFFIHFQFSKEFLAFDAKQDSLIGPTHHCWRKSSI